MSPRQSSARLIKELTDLSRGKLDRPDDLALLVDAASSADLQQALEDISFHAKFIMRAHRIMVRIGKDGDGYEKLTAELNASLDTVRGLLRTLSEGLSPAERERFAAEYLETNMTSLQNLFALCNDLMWYKNWLIDHRGRSG